ncbi:MAG: RagB/SusD family nutrient uptake outer membrane protein [Tannerellaceae bacterium]|nr:RagB/SusD family nutrient uptake outer membrane protein [Tannerellaceae bacterium]
MKTNIVKLFACGLTLWSFTACNSYLEKENFDIITPDQVWDEPKLINAVLVNLYDKLEIDGFNYWHQDAWRLMNPTTLSDEAQGSFQKDPMFDNANATYTYEDGLFEKKFSDQYKNIRNCNDFIAQLEEAQSLSESDKELLLAETRFLRAFQYFALVKRYGGVPLIDEPQVYDPSDLESLQVPRAKEADVYTFIINECREAAKVLPVTRGASDRYRAEKGAALALCSRAALYAGSIAKYGTVELDGVVGINSGESANYFQTAYEVSNELIDLHRYDLYNKKPDDKAQNYCDMFLKGNGDNGEYIFQKQYNVAGNKGHDWDKRNAPFSINGGGWGCGVAPTLEMVEAYQYLDGTDGTLQLENADGTPRRFDDPYELFGEKDPRLFASVYLPGSPMKGSIMEWRRGVIDRDGTHYVATSQPDGGNTVELNGITYSTSGKDGGADAGDASKTGFYQKKFFDETLENMEMGQSETPWVIFRLGEIYLNLAEAAFELGKTGEALAAVNEIRQRAGMPAYSSIDMAKIRHERKVELAFEAHRYWDMKRWRIAHLDVAQGGLNGFRGTALYPWYNVSDGKYTFERGTTPPKQIRIFLQKNYYTKIHTDDMNSNPKLVQNPGYTN